MELIVLGSGGPRATGRGETSYIVSIAGVPRVLVDAGSGAFVEIGKLNLDLDKMDVVLLTHLHIDHSADLPSVFNARSLSADDPITYHVFGPDAGGEFPSTTKFLHLIFDRGGIYQYQRGFGVEETIDGKDLPTALNTPETGNLFRGRLAYSRNRHASRRLPFGRLSRRIQKPKHHVLRRYGRIRARESRETRERHRSARRARRNSRPARHSRDLADAPHSAKTTRRSRKNRKRQTRPAQPHPAGRRKSLCRRPPLNPCVVRRTSRVRTRWPENRVREIDAARIRRKSPPKALSSQTDCAQYVPDAYS